MIRRIVNAKFFITLVLFNLVLGNIFSVVAQFAPTQQYNISSGLSHNGVTSILEDSKGYLWVATFDGLNRYDGYGFKTYRNSVRQKTICSNRVRTLFEDSKGNVWVGTEEGISVYSFVTETFIMHYSNELLHNGKPDLVVLNITEDEERGLILCATEGQGILIFNSDLNFQEICVPTKNMIEEAISFFDVVVLDSDNYAYLTSRGLVILNLSTRMFKMGYKIGLYYESDISKVKEGQLLLTVDDGIIVIDYSLNNDEYVFALKKRLFRFNRFSFAEVDKDNNLWLGNTRNGLIKIDDFNQLLSGKKYVREEFVYPLDMLRVSSYCFSKLRQTVWIGTFNKGLLRFNMNENPFKYYDTSKDDPLGIQANEIINLAPINSKKFYAKTNVGGLTVFNVETEKFEPLPFSVPKIPKTFGPTFFMDNKENTWLKLGKGGLFNNKSGGLKPAKIQCEYSSEFLSVRLKASVMDGDGNIWMAGPRGIYIVKQNKKGEIISIDSFKKHPLFKDIALAKVVMYYDSQCDIVWVGTEKNGLFRFKLAKDISEVQVDQYLSSERNSISSNFVSSILRVPNGDLWIGTEQGGICKVVNADDKPKFTIYTTVDGLSNDVVKSLEYENNNLWISTNKGLTRYDLLENTFRIFNIEDGLPFESFTYFSAKMGDMLVFSATEGFCYFNPDNIQEKEPLPILHLEEFMLYNDVVCAGDSINNRIILNKALANTDEINLKHNENVFSIKVNSLHYSTPESHFIAYKLLPINQEWIKVASNQKKLNYNGLAPGEYILKVKASNSLNEWTEPKNIRIVIAPPFWKTAWAYIIYILILGSIVYAVVYVVLNMQGLKHTLHVEQLEKDKDKAVSDAKMRFFSNISHEIKTPLSLIDGPVDILHQRLNGNKQLIEKVEMVQRQSKKISQLVDQVHDFQRADANKLKVNYSMFNFNDLITELIGDFKFMAERECKKIELTQPNEIIEVWADRSKLEKLFNNLLSNSFKYSDRNDSIRVSFYAENNKIIIKVADTGHGIEEEDLPHIFERFYQSYKNDKEYSGGSGIGLAFSKRLVEMHMGYIEAESERGTGTTMTVGLPILKSKLEIDQVSSEEELLVEEKSKELSTDVNTVRGASEISSDVNMDAYTIFLVEDNVELRTFVSDFLSAYCTVKSFINGKECLLAMQEEWPDIVVSDVLMPELNGFDLCKSIKSDIKTSHIPVVLLTACTSIEDKVKGLRLGADAYIQKPFNIGHLLVRIESLILNRKHLRDRFTIDYPIVLKKDEQGSLDTAFLEKLYSVLENNLDNLDLDVDLVIKELYLNRTDFYKKVKALTNKTPYELIKAYRIKKAADLLVHNKLSVNEAFIMTGFKSRSHFNKYFKEMYEVPPGKYAVSVKDKIEA